MGSDFLKRQHEGQRLRHAIDYVWGETRTSKKLTTSELARLNRIVTASDEPAWRVAPAEIQIPSGKLQRFSVISNPVEDARRILGQGYDLANNGEVETAAIYVYLQLIAEHLFQEGNRRTAALAAQWILNEKDQDVDTLKLLDIPIGDVRDPQTRRELGEQIKTVMKE